MRVCKFYFLSVEEVYSAVRFVQKTKIFNRVVFPDPLLPVIATYLPAWFLWKHRWKLV